MRKTILQGVLSGLCFALVATGMVAADDPKGARAKAEPAKSTVKMPSAAATLQKVVKNAARAKGYRTKVDIVGGFATREDHEVTEITVRESFQGDIFGELMQSSTPKVFRTANKGAAYVSGGWKNILSDRDTVKMMRLFSFPKQLFDKAVLHSAKGAKWLEGVAPAAATRAPVVEDDQDDETADAASGSDAQPGGKTVVTSKGKKTTSAATLASMPRFIRVELPAEEALTQLISVQNSNCFGGG